MIKREPPSCYSALLAICMHVAHGRIWRCSKNVLQSESGSTVPSFTVCMPRCMHKTCQLPAKERQRKHEAALL